MKAVIYNIYQKSVGGFTKDYKCYFQREGVSVMDKKLALVFEDEYNAEQFIKEFNLRNYHLEPFPNN